MKWKNVKQLHHEQFKRRVGVARNTFNTMVSEYKRLLPASTHKIRGKKRGPKALLRKEDELLMLLMYYRECRTFYHIAGDYALSETHAGALLPKQKSCSSKAACSICRGRKN